MTNNVLLKRAVIALFLISILVNCDMWNSRFGREEVKLGEYVTLRVESPDETVQVRWVFAELPDSSLPAFLPADTLDLVSFQPDRPGKYDVVLEITKNGEVEATNYFYDVVMNEDSSLVVGEIPQHLFDRAVNDDTTESTTPENGLTEEEDQRRYLDKLVSPAEAKAPVKQKRPTPIKKSTKSKPAPISRGNLIPLASRTYTIQVSSWPSLEDAQSASNDLLNNYGIDSYIQRAFFKYKDEIYYRLRVGNFKESKDAEAYAKVIQEMTSLPVWVDFVRQEM